MQVKKLLDFGGSLGIILPREMTKALGVRERSKVWIFFVSPDMIVITKNKYRSRIETLTHEN